MGLSRNLSGHVFTYKGRPYSESMMRKVWNAACQKVGVKNLSLYEGSRHSVASDAVQRGVSIYDVKDALRHSDIRTTMKYAHLDQSAKKRVILDSGKKVVRFPKEKNRP